MTSTKILIVEDESIIAKDLQTILRDAGYEVPHTANNSKDALRFVEEISPDLILMDVIIKGPVDGITTAQIIGTLYDIPVIFLSAYSDKMTLDRARVVGSFGYLLKPCDERELLIAVDFGLQKANMDRVLKNRNALYSAVIGNLEKGVIVTNKNEQIELVNTVALQFLGAIEADVMGKPISEILFGFQHGIYDQEIRAFGEKVVPSPSGITETSPIVYSNQKLLNHENEFTGNLIYIYKK